MLQVSKQGVLELGPSISPLGALRPLRFRLLSYGLPARALVEGKGGELWFSTLLLQPPLEVLLLLWILRELLLRSFIVAFLGLCANGGPLTLIPSGLRVLLSMMLLCRSTGRSAQLGSGIVRPILMCSRPRLTFVFVTARPVSAGPRASAP